MECREVAEIIFMFFDNELDRGRQEPLREHLSQCPDCARQLEYTRRLLILVRRRCVRHPAPPHLRRKILTSLPHRQDPT